MGVAVLQHAGAGVGAQLRDLDRLKHLEAERRLAVRAPGGLERRIAMADQGLDGFVAPHEDEHQNEYLPAANDRLAWATGFTGSAGAAVILKDKAAIFVDGRYTLQVRDQVDQGTFEIRDLVEGGVPAYLETAAPRGAVIGYDPRLHSPDALERL